jgi:hypothetical protein
MSCAGVVVTDVLCRIAIANAQRDVAVALPDQLADAHRQQLDDGLVLLERLAVDLRLRLVALRDALARAKARLHRAALAWRLATRGEPDEQGERDQRDSTEHARGSVLWTLLVRKPLA